MSSEENKQIYKELWNTYMDIYSEGFSTLKGIDLVEHAASARGFLTGSNRVMELLEKYVQSNVIKDLPSKKKDTPDITPEEIVDNRQTTSRESYKFWSDPRYTYKISGTGAKEATTKFVDPEGRVTYITYGESESYLTFKKSDLNNLDDLNFGWIDADSEVDK